MKRRKFLKNSTLASGTFFVPHFIKAYDQLQLPITNDKKLVIIQLAGGNDGLNTIVPYTNDLYFKNRPSIALHKGMLLKVNDTLGFHKALNGFKALFDQGNVSIINGVGYPNPSRSHFRATDIWHTASSSHEIAHTGWVGRYLDNKGYGPLGAIEVDDTLSLILKGNTTNGLATKNAQLLYKNTLDPYFSKILQSNTDAHLSEHNLGYLYKTAVEAKSSARYIFEKSKTSKSKLQYPQNAFAKQLKTMAEFINSGLSTQIYYTSLGGFDTHANQVNAQDRLLGVYSEAISVFVNDLKQSGTFKNTMILTFSEFGRRVKQNAANGTDHGAANSVFLIGESLKKPGIYNQQPLLTDLDANGDIKYSIDFRQIYTTLLKLWLKMEASEIITENFEPLPLI